MVMERLTRREVVTLLEQIEAARGCSGMEGLGRLIGSLDGLLSFDMAVCGIAQFDEAGAMNSQRIVNISYPQQWLSLYEERGFAAVDPVVRAHFADHSPKIWGDTYRQWGRPQPFLSLAEDFGIREGYSFGALSPTDRTVTIFSLSINKKPTTHALELLDILAPHFHEALQRAVQPPRLSFFSPLTQREAEVIRWLANGKNTWEISMILGISERTVKFHSATIVQKLGASNRTHAVAKALSYGWMSLD